MPFNFFDKPKPLPQLTLNQVLGDTSSQTGQLPGLAALTSQANSYTNNQFRDSISSILPGYQSGLATSMGNANSFLQGNIPTDVQNYLSRTDAFKALSGGFGASSGMGRGLAARDLGLTSLDLIGRGQSMLGQDIGLAEGLTPGRLSPGQFLMGPGQVAGLDAQNNMIQYKNDTSQSPFDQFLNQIPGMAINGAMQYATGGMGGLASGFMKGFGDNGGANPNPFSSFNPMLSGSNSNWSPSSSVFNRSNNYDPSIKW